jgi:SHS2 domain-containing protein
MKTSERTLAISNMKLEDSELTEKEADMIELVASVLDSATYELLNDLLFEFKKEVDVDNVLDEIELRYESLGITVKFSGERAGKEATLPKKKRISAGNDPGYYV